MRPQPFAASCNSVKIVRDWRRERELKTGTLHAMCGQLGIKKDEL